MDRRHSPPGQARKSPRTMDQNTLSLSVQITENPIHTDFSQRGNVSTPITEKLEDAPASVGFDAGASKM